MTPTEQALLLLILLVGAILVISLLLKAGLERLGIPALVGYVILGLLVNATEEKWHPFSALELEVFEFLADIGIICLLFRVGLESIGQAGECLVGIPFG